MAERELKESSDGRVYSIELVRNWWEVRDSKNRLVACASSRERVDKVGPWRPAMSKAQWDGGSVDLVTKEPKVGLGNVT